MWHELDAGRWRLPDHIILGEGRAVVRLCQALSLLPGAHDHAWRIMNRWPQLQQRGARRPRISTTC
eukprot:2029682-Pyramimonas_sp.AAC.1